MSTQIIEHIVFLKFKTNTDTSELTSITNKINSLVSLPQVLHIAMAPIHKIQSSSSLTFTHMVHVRFNSKSDLDTYNVHPNHVTVAKAIAPFLDDIMALDWVARNHHGDIIVPPEMAVRVMFLKVRDDSVGDEVLGVVGGSKDKFGGNVRQFSCGQNFSPATAKGFLIGSLVVFGGIEELREVDLDEGLGKEEKEKIGEYVESEIVVDYVVPSCEV